MHSTKLSLALAVAGALLAAAPAAASTYTVKNDNGGGLNSLRWAIQRANDHVGHDAIVFQIEPPGMYTIAPTMELPAITDSVDIDGTTQPGYAGTPVITIDATQLGNGLDLVASDSTIRGLTIGGAGLALGAGAPNGNAILVEGDRNAILENHLGVDGTGTAGVGNNNAGVRVEGDNTIIGLPGLGNVIGNNLQDGVQARADTAGTVLEANLIGLGVTGGPLGNGDAGVEIRAGGTRVGGSDAPAANVIADNVVGVRIAGGTDSRVTGNLIGTDAVGAVAVGNDIGVELRSAANVVGGSEPGEGNVISGNTLQGIRLLGDANSVLGNTIGSVGLPNHTGVAVSGDENTIGAGNTIAGNAVDGVRIETGGDRDRVEASTIETNGRDGVALLDARHAVVTDSDLSRNARNGVYIRNADPAGPIVTSADHRIADNAIDENGSSGIRIVESDGNLIDDGNRITANAADGVTVESGTRNAILGNSIFDNRDLDNGDLAIDLGDDGVTGNDALDTDTGANLLQNHPALGALTKAGLSWTLDAQPSTRYRIELHASVACNGGAFSESADATTDATGHAEGTFAGIQPPRLLPRYYTATATALATLGPVPTPQSTSELSPCRMVAPA